MKTDGIKQAGKRILVPGRYNYIAVFLTLSCNLACNYCINRFGEFAHEKGRLSGREWVTGLNRIVSRDDLPLTLQGGEPSLHPDFSMVVRNIKSELNVDLLTNLEFDIDKFMKDISPDRMRRKAPYASIRVSYHPETMKLEPLAGKVLKLQKAGYSIGIWGVRHPCHEQDIMRAQEYCRARGIDFRTKEFLGEHKGKLYGTYKYPGAFHGGTSQVLCKTTELIIGPDGGVYRCHADLYEGRKAIGHILDPQFEIDDRSRPCNLFGQCNPCDVKIKTDRFQVFGHTSVAIRFRREAEKQAGLYSKG